jgi:hypothetical protein
MDDTQQNLPFERDPMSLTLDELERQCFEGS